MSNAPIKKSDRCKKWAQRSLKGSIAQVLDERKKILIVTQDGKSSRYYFEAWRGRFAKGAVYLTVASANLSPLQLVSSLPAIRQQRELNIVKSKKVASFRFDEVWVAFDCDSFQDFDAAVYALRRMSKDGFREAWSNECFELWYLLHRASISGAAPIPRTKLFNDCTMKFDVANRYHVPKYEKIKGAVGKDFHSEMANSKPEDIIQAISNATSMNKETMSVRGGSSAQPSNLNPLTHVHELIREFIKQSPEFVNQNPSFGF